MVGLLTRAVIITVLKIEVIHDRGARHGAKGNILRRQARGRTDDDAVIKVVGVIECPLQYLHAAE